MAYNHTQVGRRLSQRKFGALEQIDFDDNGRFTLAEADLIKNGRID
ncbi:MAG: hypothetical protein KC419_20090 [Anaerolineales bacterium]|nr:hypothetical protein [Anaerolineales bacterium]